MKKVKPILAVQTSRPRVIATVRNESTGIVRLLKTEVPLLKGSQENETRYYIQFWGHSTVEHGLIEAHIVPLFTNEAIELVTAFLDDFGVNSELTSQLKKFG